MRNYTYNEVSRILETRAKGILKIGDIIDHYEIITNEESFPRNLKVLIDCRGAQMDIKVDETGQIHAMVKKALSKYNYIKEAILVDKPNETVIAMLFDYYSSDLKTYSFHVFSIENVAREWLY